MSIFVGDNGSAAVPQVSAYSPHDVAEHGVGLMLTLNRKFHRAFERVRPQNVALEGLMGFDMHGKAAGGLGTGRKGPIVCRMMSGSDAAPSRLPVRGTPRVRRSTAARSARSRALSVDESRTPTG